MNAIATPKSVPDAGLGVFTKKFRSRIGSRQMGELDRFSYPFLHMSFGAHLFGFRVPQRNANANIRADPW